VIEGGVLQYGGVQNSAVFYYLYAMKEIVYSFWMLVGTYTGGESEGIYVYGFDPETARTEYVGMVQVDNPSYLTVSADGHTVYSVSENNGAASFAGAFAFDAATGELIPMNREETSGSAPCNIATNGHIALTANYGGGDVSVFGVGEGGALTPQNQTLKLPGGSAKSHMHCVKFSPDGKYLFASDLGTDKLLRWDVSDTGTLDENSLKTFDVPAGSGPRHFIFDSSGCNIYLINEVSGTVIAFRYSDGNLEQFQTILADTVGGHGSADIVLTPNGRWLYASNRLKNDGVAIFAVSPEDGTLTSTGYRTTGIHPRNLSIAPGGKYLLSAARDSDVIEIFEIDYTTGALMPTDRNITLDQPVCVKFIAAKR
jgi:6-phosphogluconolactonase (cycloisomerase 2 family)